MTPNQRAARIQALRDLADLLEACPALPVVANIFAPVVGLDAEAGAELLAEARVQVEERGLRAITFRPADHPDGDERSIIFALRGGLIYETDQRPADVTPAAPAPKEVA